ncbi:MAG: hypothetical protein GTO40_09490, partial [Deltaproteobacteria bacterium]|nr:hypothetical protein [Deltaproteobacteria bacterium]
MSRKTLLTVILALAVVLFTAPQVLAVGVSASRHDMTADGMDLAASFTGIEDRGVCSFCHVPHGGGTERLWAGTMGSLPGVGTVANLCYSCHNDPAIVGAGTSTKMFTPSTNTVHGYDETFMPGEGNNLAGSGFPYIGDADTIIECTTCHNVHVQDNAPFLRAAFQDFCQNCHTGRQGTGEMNANMNGSGFSTHPILTLTTTPDANRPVVIPGRYDLPIAGTTSAAARVAMWTIGGHRNASSEVICQTCHAVHGYDPAAEAAGAEVGYNDSDAFGAAVLVDAFMIGGTGGAYGNEICVNCHGENPNTGPGGVIGINHRYSAGANRADVGNTGDANESTSQNDLAITVAAAAQHDTGRMVCSSCHDVHFG